MDYKIIFSTEWPRANILNDNVDINVVMENGTIYWGTLFTIQNIKHLMEKEKQSFFWSVDMVIVKELSSKDINEVVYSIVDSGIIEQIFSNIGNIEQQFPGVVFEDIVHMGMGHDL